MAPEIHDFEYFVPMPFVGMPLHPSNNMYTVVGSGTEALPMRFLAKTEVTVEFKNDYVLGFIICEIFTVIALQDWVGWGIFTVIPGIHGERTVTASA